MMEQAGEMVGQVNGEFLPFNDNTFLVLQTSFWELSRFYATFRESL